LSTLSPITIITLSHPHPPPQSGYQR
jgi:hypothetical protein